MNEIAELKRKLAEAEQRAKTEQVEIYRAEHNKKYAGNAFVSMHRNRIDTALLFRRYYTLAAPDVFGKMTYRAKSVRIAQSKTGTSGAISSDDTTHYFDANFEKPLYEEPISLAEFNAIWKYAGTLYAAAFTGLKDKCSRAKLDCQCDEKVTEAIDVPYLQLEPYDLRFFESSPFLLPGNRYLLTPNSRQAILTRLNTEEQQLNAGMSLYQECDMEYVRSTLDRIHAVRDLVTSQLR